MQLSILHVTRYNYAPPAQRAELRIRLFPAALHSQQASTWQVSVNGRAVAPLMVNAFGDAESVWRADAVQDTIEIVAEGIVETQDAAGVLRGHAERAAPAMFLRETKLTAADEGIRELAHSARANSSLESLHRLCEGVRAAIEYEQDVTNPQTTAAEALALGGGVCQDHAHVFIAAARALGVPARYVAGYLAPGHVGRQESHAWAEAFVPDLGWVGFDPANRQCPTEAYVRLCAGFDAADAAPLRGWVSTGAVETLAVSLDVTAMQAQQ